MQTVNGYYYILLDPDIVVGLKTLAEHPEIHCHHVTVAYKPNIDQARVLDTLVGKRYHFRATQLVKDAKGQALGVDLQTNNRHSHVTISCAHGVKPVYSNALLALPADQVQSRPYAAALTGVLQYEAFK
jgi:hypothetical protein